MKKILLVADQPGWIFDRHCKEIKSRLSLEYHFDIAYHRHNIPELSKSYDLVYMLDPMHLPHGYSPKEKTIMGLRNEFLYKEHPNGAKGLYECGILGRCSSIKDKCSILHMVNKNQINIFKDIVLDKPLVLAQHGIDEGLFIRSKYEKISNGFLNVGVSGRDSRNKGFGYVQEACGKSNCKFVGAQYGSNQISKEKMPEFYSKLDIFVCFSKSEGENNAIMEAGAMGVPVISTRSGHAEEVIKDGVNGFLINRDVDSLVIAIDKLKDDKIRISMGDNMYNEIIKNWTWKVRIEDFRKMFGIFFERG